RSRQASISGTCCSRDKYRDRWNTPGASSMRFPRTLPLTGMSRPTLIGMALTLLGVAIPAAAHPVPFSYVDVGVGPGALDVTIVAHIYDVAHAPAPPPARVLPGPSV